MLHNIHAWQLIQLSLTAAVLKQEWKEVGDTKRDCVDKHDVAFNHVQREKLERERSIYKHVG